MKHHARSDLAGRPVLSRSGEPLHHEGAEPVPTREQLAQRVGAARRAGALDEELDGPVSRVEVEVADAVGWDDRKKLLDVWQDAGQRVERITPELYEALVEVARFGARCAVRNLLDD